MIQIYIYIYTHYEILIIYDTIIILKYNLTMVEYDHFIFLLTNLYVIWKYYLFFLYPHVRLKYSLT